MSPIYSGDVDTAPADEDISSLQTTLGRQLAATAADTWDQSPTSELMHINEMASAKGMVPYVGDGAIVPPELAKAFSDQPEISQDDAKAKVKAAGLEGALTVPNTPRVKQAAIDLMIENAQNERQRAATIADGPRGFVPGALDFGTGFLVGAADPLNIAASMIPVVGEARYAKLMASAGDSILARAAVRAGTGAAGGAAFTAATLPAEWLSDTSDGRDFTFTQALRSVLAGAGQFGFLHVGGGLVSDLWRSIGPSSARRPLYPFASGEAFERRASQPSTEPVGGQPVNEPGAPAAAPGAPGAEAQAGAPEQATKAESAVPGNAPRPQPQGAPARSLEEVFANPRVKSAFDGLRVDRSSEVPFGAAADAEDANAVHIDKRIPTEDVINGVSYDPATPLALRELETKDAIEHDGVSPGAALRGRGDSAERAWVTENLGANAWPIYQRRIDGWVAGIDHTAIEGAPETLYTKPLEAKQREQGERVSRYEAARLSERKEIEREVSQGVYRAGRSKAEAATAGKLFAARYTTRASRFGERAGTPLEMFRQEHLQIRRGEPNFVSTGSAFEQPGAPDLFAQREAEGQQNLEGTERIGQGELAQRRADQPLRPTKEQKPLDVGLFSDDAAQGSLLQGGAGGPRGRITMRPNRAIVDLFKSADTSTFLHEAGHLWLEELTHDAAHDEAPQQVRDDFSAVLKWLGVDKAEDIGKDQHEQWARGFEQYLLEGRAPSKGLAAVFEKFREWLGAIYRSVSELHVPLNDEIRGVMDRMLASDPEIAEMQGSMRSLPDPAKEDMLKATIGSMHDGKVSPAMQMIEAAARDNATVARTAGPIVSRAEPGNVTQAPAATAAEIWRNVAERKAPENEEQAIEAFKAAEALPEPPSADAEPERNSTVSLAAARRAAEEGADVDLKVNKPSARGPRARPEQTWSLMEYLASKGGISPAERNIGDVRAILGRSNKFIPGFGHLIRQGGMTLDRAREAAVLAHYLRDNALTGESGGELKVSIRDLLDAIDDEARGKRRYREGSGPPEAETDPALLEHWREQDRAHEAAIDAELTDAGIEPATVDPALRSRMREIMTFEHEADPVLAWERAVMEKQLDDSEAGQFERSPEQVSGWNQLDDAGAASPGSRSPGAGGRGAGEGAGQASSGAGAGAREAGASAVAADAVTPLAKAAVELDARSAANFEIEAADLPIDVRTRIDEAIGAVDREAVSTADAIRTAAAALGAGADPQNAIMRTVQVLASAVPQATIESEIKAIDGAIKVFEQEGIPKGEAAQRAADSRLDKNAERAAIARRTEREHALAIIRENRNINGLQSKGVPVRDALEAITAGVNTPFFRSRDSIEARWHTLHNKYVGDAGVDGALRRGGLSKLAYSQTIDDDIEREAYELDLADRGKPGVTKNPQALAIAKIFHAADKQAMTDHNLAGGWLRTLSGHTTRQQWNPEAIRSAALGGNARRIADELRPGKAGLEADRIAFVGDFMGNLDLKRTFGRMPEQAVRDQLYQMWVPLKNGDHLDYTLPMDDPIYPNVPGKAAAHREFFFKSPEAARTMRKKYGLYPSFIESKYRGYETLSRQTALIGRLGPKPDEAITEIRKHALEITKATNDRQNVEKFVNGRGGGYEMSMLDKQMGLLTGKANKPLYQLGARIASGWMAWERMSMLGRVLLTHIEGLPTKSSELRYWGASAVDRYKGFFADMRRAAPESERGKLMQLIWSGHDADNSYRESKYDTADTAPGILSRLSDVYFRLTGITHVLPNQRQGAQHVMARELAMERGKAFADIDPSVQRILGLYGIAEPEWKLLHGTEWTTGRTPEGDGPGGSSPNAFLTPEDALSLNDASVKAYLQGKPAFARPSGEGLGIGPDMIARARNDLASQIATMYTDRGNYAMFQGASIRTRARLFGNTVPGTLAGIAVRLLWQFKQWPIEMIYRTWGREIYGGNQGMGRVASVVELAVAATVMGTLGEMVRDGLKGENPLPRLAQHPIDYMLHGLVRSGIGSIAGDYLFGEFDRHWRTVLESAVGPTFGQVNDLFDLYYGGGADERHPWQERGADALQMLKTNGGPLVNFWATSWAFQYLVWFRLQEWLHPGYVERYQRKMEKEQGTSFIMSPQTAIGR